MIALPDTSSLDPLERFALATLVDAAALLPAEGDAVSAAVRLVVDPWSRADADGPFLAGAPAEVPFFDGEVRFPEKWLRPVGEMLSMHSDGVTAPKDRHGRPLSSANRLVQAGIERHPVVSRLAHALADSARRAAGPRPYFVIERWPERRRWAACLSHDLDVASLWPAFTALRAVELLRKGDLARVGSVLGAAGRALLGDPVRDGVRAALAAEREAGAVSSWYVICGYPTLVTMKAGDVTYDPESWRVRQILRELREAGHEVGLHGSFATAADGAEFVEQRARLERLAGRGITGVRQHFLKRTIGVTERAMASAGFAYDSTAGFPDRNGFRLGLADVLPVWDHESGTALALDELPFCWMDRAQSKYQGIEDPNAWIDDALELAARAAESGAVWCGIWHPNLTPALGYPGAHEAYARLVRSLAADGAWLASAESIVRWRRARRSLRATALASSGAPVVRGDADAIRAAGAPLVVTEAGQRLRVEVSP